MTTYTTTQEHDKVKVVLLRNLLARMQLLGLQDGWKLGGVVTTDEMVALRRAIDLLEAESNQ